MISLVVRWTEYRGEKVTVEDTVTIADLFISASTSAHGIFRRLWSRQSARKQIEKAARYAFGEVYIYDIHGKCIAVFTDNTKADYLHMTSLTEEVERTKKENK